MKKQFRFYGYRAERKTEDARLSALIHVTGAKNVSCLIRYALEEVEKKFLPCSVATNNIGGAK